MFEKKELMNQNQKSLYSTSHSGEIDTAKGTVRTKGKNEISRVKYLELQKRIRATKSGFFKIDFLLEV